MAERRRIEDEDEEDEDDSSSEDEDATMVQDPGPEKLWDGFRDIPKNYESGSMADTKFFDVSVEILKIVSYLLTFCVVLFGAVLAKGLLVLMTSQLVTDSKPPTICRDKTLYAGDPRESQKPVWIWALLIAFTVPELGAFIRSVRMWFFKSYLKPDEVGADPEKQDKTPKEKKHILVRRPWIMLALMETLHVIGTAIFIFEVLPQMDAVRAVMLTNCVCFVPGILSALSHNNKEENSRTRTIMDASAVALQFTGFLAWPILEGTRAWFIPLALLLMSCKWWINYVSKTSPYGFMRILGYVKEEFKETEILIYRAYLFISLWKIALFFCTTLIILSAQGSPTVYEFFHRSYDAFNQENFTVIKVSEAPIGSRVFYLTDLGSVMEISNTAVWYVVGTQILGAYLCYVFGKFACKILIQEFSFAFPSILVTPVTVLVIILMAQYRQDDFCVYNNVLPNYLFFNAPDYDAEQLFTVQHAWVWVFWLLSQVWITYHIWNPRCDRRAKTEKLFALPMYCDLLVDQCITLNRRRDEIETAEEPDFVENIKIPHIIACATMWHESKPEMLEMLKSILRMDLDQCVRRIAKDQLNNSKADRNYYTFETHIFFDDAFELEDTINENMIVNPFVKDFVGCMNKAVKAVHQSDKFKVGHPTKYPTPYGGRLEYTLPGKTILYVHLKDKAKIRHRKRWSQVMYMYYLLGFRLMELPMDAVRKDIKAHNTYLLALDGDIDFKPSAVALLVDLMKKDDNLGAACGRIHPVGSGFMVWYQLFEYAIGHWLQKATEHMIGCVLCSPGCFSLFRGRALMDDNVMKRYTTKAEEARHYVQYDQGEDRWLCTLLLQRGYRVEYSAASDAFTHCPESFNEFYTQRRRWVPSTMANIMDLLEDYKHTVKINNNISLPYIAYQMMLLAGTILGPGTIFLMLVGAFNAAFKIDNWTAFYYNLVPIVLYILICFFAKEKFQLLAALIISAIYGLIMMAVLVGILIEINDDGPLAPSALFLFIVAGEIIVAGLVHPQEVLCLPSGAIYYVTIPSMYLLLIIYSVCNLNIVTWGTREVATKKTKAELEQEKKDAEEAKKKAKEGSFFGFLDSFSNKNKSDEEGSIEFSLAGLFRCMFCTHPRATEEKQQLIRIIDSLGGVKKRLDNIEKLVDRDPLSSSSRRRTTARNSYFGKSDDAGGNLDSSDELLDQSEEEEEPKIDKEERDDLQNPYWAEELKKGKLEFLPAIELDFWKELINKYLYPLIEDKAQKAKISSDLKELRDRMALSFFMLNALFVTVVFLLQLNKDAIFINWPLGAKANITFDQLTQEINVTKTYLELEPIGLVFVLFFAIILIIQFTAMLFHRFETLCTLLSTTTLTLFGIQKKTTAAQIMDEAVKKAKKKVKIVNQQEDIDAPINEGPVNKRNTIFLMEKEMRQSRQSANLDDTFNVIFKEVKEEREEQAKKEENRNSRRSIFMPISKKRNSQLRNSQLRLSGVNKGAARPVSGYNNSGFSAIMEETELRNSNEQN